MSDKPGTSVKKNILRASWLLIGSVVCLFFYILYIECFEAEKLIHHPLNLRGTEGVSGVVRGRIIDAQERVLAESDDSGARIYPYGEAAAPVTGYIGANVGSAGIENYASIALSGQSAAYSRLGPIAQLFTDTVGGTVKLTIDAELQQTAYDALDGRHGAVVVLDAESGAVLTLACAPSYDPEDIGEAWEDISKQKDGVLLNRAAAGLYPPGSSIKPLVAAFALADGKTTTQEHFSCTGVLDVGGGYTISESHGGAHGDILLREALSSSCNVTFGALGMRMGANGLRDMFARAGLDQRLSGDIESPIAELPKFSALSPGEQAQIGIGQSTLLVTPLAMAMIAGGFANEGKMMTPYLIDETLTSKGAVISKTVPKAWKGSLPKAEAVVVDSYMETVVREGTGTAAQVRGIRITGKTGTAENASGEDHAWFIGTARVNGRKIAFAIVIENGGSGGRTAAPIARSLILRMM